MYQMIHNRNTNGRVDGIKTVHFFHNLQNLTLIMKYNQFYFKHDYSKINSTRCNK